MIVATTRLVIAAQLARPRSRPLSTRSDGPLSTRGQHCRHREERDWLLRRSTSLQSEETIVWRRRLFGGWRGRRAVGSRRSGFGYSFGTVLLVISGALLLFLYLTGRLNL